MKLARFPLWAVIWRHEYYIHLSFLWAEGAWQVKGRLDGAWLNLGAAFFEWLDLWYLFWDLIKCLKPGFTSSEIEMHMFPWVGVYTDSKHFLSLHGGAQITSSGSFLGLWTWDTMVIVKTHPCQLPFCLTFLGYIYFHLLLLSKLMGVGENFQYVSFSFNFTLFFPFFLSSFLGL